MGVRPALLRSTYDKLCALGARYYDPNIGRFTQPDPSGQEKNPYLYAEGDPVNRIDPTGLFSFGDFLKDTIGGALVGAAGGCVTGAVGSIWTGPGALAGCGIGAATGGAGGLVTGAGTYLWNDLT